MKKIALLILAATVSAQAATYEDYARVLSVQEKYGSSGQPRKVCDGGGSNSSGLGMGTVIGAVSGGLLGNTVGHKSGKVAAAAVGAATGAVAGTYIENGMNGGNNSGGRNCYMVNDQQPRVIGYDVTYEYGGHQLTDYFQTPPNGDTIRVRINTMPSSGR